MEAKINVGKGGNEDYLYCSVDIQVSNYQEMYDSSEECFDDLKPEIIEDCKKRGYSEEETQSVLSFYQIKFSNAQGVWEDKY